MKRYPLFLPLLLAACSGDDPAQTGGLTKREAQELDEAAQALDRKDPVPSLANTPIPAVPAPPADPEVEEVVR